MNYDTMICAYSVKYYFLKPPKICLKSNALPLYVMETLRVRGCIAPTYS
jgi:hypothetical protein